MSDAKVPGCTLNLSAETLSAWRDSALPGREQEHVSAHLPGCATCRSRLAEYDSMARALQTLSTPKPVGGYGRNPRLQAANRGRWTHARSSMGMPGWASALAAVLLLAAFAGLFAVFASRRPSITVLPTPTSTVTATPTPVASVATTLDLTTAPTGTPPEAAGVWFLDVVDHRATQVNPTTNTVVASIPVPSDVYVLGATADALWVTRNSAGTVERLDPHTGHVIATIPLQPHLRIGITFSANSLWVASGANNTVWRIDTRTNRVVAKIAVGAFPQSVAVGDGTLWVCNGHEIPGLWRIDLNTSRVVAKIDVSEGRVSDCGGVAVAPDGSVWVINYYSDDDTNDLLRINPQANAVIASIPLGKDVAFGLVAEDDAIWAVSDVRQVLLRVDPQTNRLLGSMALNKQPVFAVLEGGVLWVQSGITDDSGSFVAGGRLWRIMLGPSIDG
jgi:YVTN family beta-propeller protein